MWDAATTGDGRSHHRGPWARTWEAKERAGEVRVDGPQALGKKRERWGRIMETKQSGKHKHRRVYN